MILRLLLRREQRVDNQIFKLLSKDDSVEWNNEGFSAFLGCRTNETDLFDANLLAFCWTPAHPWHGKVFSTCTKWRGGHFALL